MDTICNGGTKAPPYYKFRHFVGSSLASQMSLNPVGAHCAPARSGNPVGSSFSRSFLLFLQFFSHFQKKILTNRKICIILYKKVEAHCIISMRSCQRLPQRRSQKGNGAEDGKGQNTDLAGGTKSSTVVAAMRRAIQKPNTRSMGFFVCFGGSRMAITFISVYRPFPKKENKKKKIPLKMLKTR